MKSKPVADIILFIIISSSLDLKAQQTQSVNERLMNPYNSTSLFFSVVIKSESREKKRDFLLFVSE